MSSEQVLKNTNMTLKDIAKELKIINRTLLHLDSSLQKIDETMKSGGFADAEVETVPYTHI